MSFHKTWPLNFESRSREARAATRSISDAVSTRTTRTVSSADMWSAAISSPMGNRSPTNGPRSIWGCSLSRSQAQFRTGQPNPDGLPVIRKMELVPVHAGMEPVGEFHCSSDLYNRTHDLIDAAMRSNMSWVMTDCPHREKLGWLECSYLLAPSFMYRYGGHEWFSKIAHDIRDAQEPSGRVLTVAPSYPAGRFPGAFDWTVEWGAAAVRVPWHHYEWFGDDRILRDNYDMMRRFTDYIQTESKDGLAPGGLGDWYDYGHGQPPGPSRFTPTELSSTATWASVRADSIKGGGGLGKDGGCGSIPRVA